MNRQEVFDAWKAQKSQGDAGPGFTDRVMAGIRRREATRAAENLAPLLRYRLPRPWAKAAVLILGTLLGLARVIATLHLVLSAS